jgi:hypothetical protein
MLVACVSGDVFSPDLKMNPWPVGYTANCYPASRTSMPPDKRGDLLVCGQRAQSAWDVSWLRGDITSQLYANARMFRVNFHSRGRSQGRFHSPVWTCQRTSEAIECK